MSNWKDTVEVIGIVTIVASLLFVGIELRQSQQIAVASQYQARIGFNLQFYESFDEEDFPGIGDRLKRQMSESDWPVESRQAVLDTESAVVGREAVNIRKILYMFDNNQYQYSAGFVDDESWQAMRRRLMGTMQLSLGLRAEIMKFEIVSRSYQWRDSLRAEFEKMLQEASQDD